MNQRRRTADARLDELLAAEAAADLDRHEEQELQELTTDESAAERDEFIRIAGMIQASLLRRDRKAQQRMPDALRARLMEQAGEHFGDGDRSSRTVSDIASARRRRSGRLRFNAGSAGWLLAATLALAFVVFRGDAPPGTETPVADVAEQRQSLLKEPDTVAMIWRPREEPGFEQVTGDVVWNSSSQTGFIRLAGMPVNDSSQAQYQLWIVDPDRDRERPVDGGVFDISAGSGEIIVPIDAKLPIASPVAFAITEEKPGGVVVSDGPFLLVASLGGRPRPTG